ncbi:M48 family metallopeptidase [Bradyrhizobium sp. 153]|nr:M48 family metallopeptidase [Bradyrhizobium sp. 153]
MTDDGIKDSGHSKPKGRRSFTDFVIVHELLHCSVPNHGKLRKSRMLAHLGDHERLAERLRHVASRR